MKTSTSVARALVAFALLGCGARTAMVVDPPFDGGPDVGTDAGTDAPIDAEVTLRCERELTVTFTPTARTQLAVWAESGGTFATLALTDATARRGLGNRPGALQLNSGYRWPVGRRENVLPGWASARLAAGGAPFRRVVFQDRGEGVVSGPTRSASADPYYCLPFDRAASQRDGLDAVSCASVRLNSDKGRYLTEADGTYVEPFEALDGTGGERPLSLTTAYPPRRDLTRDRADHPDAETFAAHALEVMPELDAITLATPAAGERVTITYAVPASLSGAMTVSVEANTEGDYSDAYDPTRYPTPSSPEASWDGWGRDYGYPYRGQPSVVFDVVVTLPPTDREATTTAALLSPTRRGTLDASLETVPMDDTMRDDAASHPGSGADRLFVDGGARVRVEVRSLRCVP